MSNITNKIGCQANGLKIVDPNNFDGMNSSSNMSVAIEDLNISVVLRTKKKGRTVLTKEPDSGTRESTNNITINFMDGSTINGEKVLTTKYTDLTTIFDKDVINDETLGITNIDIDFNSSMAPMITINFIDVRGSSIFQNEENIAGNNSGNKYSTFFQLPYPIFELEIKGYYGRPVTYCLHMTKFNSKFNSKTGNFEIQCDFIGYTYAMLSDMLIGFLKAIPYTKIGAEMYKNYNANKKLDTTKNNAGSVITLVELMKKISEINNGVAQISATSPNSLALNSFKNGIDQLDTIYNVINALGENISSFDTSNTSDTVDSFEYIIKTSGTALTAKDLNYIELYQSNVKKAIDDFNGLGLDGITLKVEDFQLITTIQKGKGLYTNLTKKQLSDPTDTTINQQLGSTANGVNLKKNLLDYLNENYPSISDDLQFDVYDMNVLYDTISATRFKLETDEKVVMESLAVELKSSAREKLGFEPTVRNIIEIFTAAIEVFMETIYRVSSEAESLDNTDRIGELKPKFTVDLVSSDIKKEYLDANKFFAWPDYREKDEKKKTYVEKYLGSAGVLSNPKKVNELEFIDDLFNGFLKAAKDSDDVSNSMNAEETTWYPINPLDTEIFTDSEPYSRIETTNYTDITRLMLLRGMTFLGYTNNESFLSTDEIKAMAEIEAESVIRGVLSPKIKTVLSTINLNTIITTTGEINGVNRSVVVKDGSSYTYNYFNTAKPNDKHREIIPIFESFTGIWPTTPDKLVEKSVEDGFFLTNYSPNQYHPEQKVVDGGLYMQIINKNKLPQKPLVTTTTSVKKENTFSLSKLSSKDVTISAGYNTFGGSLGIQEYVNMDFGSGLDGLPLMYVFYRNYDNGLSYNRTNTGILQKTPKNAPTSSIYDYKKSGVIPMYSKKEFAYNGKNQNHVVGNLGKNRELFFEFVKSSNTSVTYPYIEQRFIDSDVTGEIREPYANHSFSLFGSQWYYFQDTAKCTLANNSTIPCSQYVKASLFLNTLPFNIKHSNVGGFNHGDPFNEYEIRNLFNKKGGLIHAPRLWCAFIGSILWKINDGSLTPKYPIVENGLIVGGGSGKKDPFIWIAGKTDINSGNNVTHFKAVPMVAMLPPVLDIDGDLIYESYPVDTTYLTKLPQQVKDEFKRIFFDFVNGSDEYISWDSIRSGLEIWKGTGEGFYKFMDTLKINRTNANDTYYFESSLLNNTNLKNLNNYNIVTLSSNLSYDDSMFLELKGDYSTNKTVGTLIDSLTQEVIIVNNNYKIWEDYNEERNSIYSTISVSNDNFNLYFNTMISKLNEIGSQYSSSAINEKYEQEIFGTSNEDTIKLILYRNCKNIHDKWLAGVTDNNDIMYQCGGASGRSSVDTKLGQQYGNDTPKFIDTFRFISRSFKDIGDDLYINPIPINDYLIDGVNSGAYDAISSLLATNNFDFVALPNFINYRDNDEVESIFKPYPIYDKAKQGGSCGPAFVCVYVGETSKHLDFKNSEYSNDGIDLRCVNGGVDMSRVPEDFTQNLNDFEDGLAVFTVKYSQQNQNIFKDIDLDQNEFTETNESLQIQEDISQKGSSTNRTIAGQNIFNVYSVRSYTANVEMMGNAMIQPMMYFQLDNIPMFHGGYMITRVKHKLSPNTMSTSFTGVRVKFTETPLLTSLDLYMDMAGSIDTSAAGTGAVNLGSYVDFYYKDLQNNKPKDITIVGTMADLNKNAITVRAEKEISNWQNGTLKESNGVSYLNVYAKATPGFSGSVYANNTQPWSAIFISYIALAGDINFPKSTSHYNYITAGMNGFLGYEVFPLNYGLKIKAEVGDIVNTKRTGGYTASHSRIIYKVSGNIAYLVGGNESDSIKVTQLNLTNGYITDSTDVNGYLLLMKQTGNKYYKKKKLISSGDYSQDAVVGCPKISKKFDKQSSYKNSIDKLLNGTFSCSAGRDCSGSIAGFKEVRDLYSNGQPTKKGIVGLTQGLLEGFGSSPNRKNPGNIRSGKGYKSYGSWKEGWQAYSDTYLGKWVNGSVTPTKSAQYPDCYSSASNKVFTDSGVKFTDKKTYNYQTGSPSLRQFSNIYAPWGDNNNPTNYCAVIARTLKDFGSDINVDDKMNTWV